MKNLFLDKLRLSRCRLKAGRAWALRALWADTSFPAGVKSCRVRGGCGSFMCVSEGLNF